MLKKLGIKTIETKMKTEMKRYNCDSVKASIIGEGIKLQVSKIQPNKGVITQLIGVVNKNIDKVVPTADYVYKIVPMSGSEEKTPIKGTIKGSEIITASKTIL